MPHITLIRMPEGEPVVVTFTEDTEFNIDNGAEGATILSLYRDGSQRIVHVRETRQQIIDARRTALSK